MMDKKESKIESLKGTIKTEEVGRSMATKTAKKIILGKDEWESKTEKKI